MAADCLRALSAVWENARGVTLTLINNNILIILNSRVIFFQLTIYRGINSDLPLWAPRGIRRIKREKRALDTNCLGSGLGYS